MTGSDRNAPGLCWEVLSPGDLQRRSREWDQLVDRAGYPPFMRAAFLARAIERFGCDRGRLVLASQYGGLRACGLVTALGRGRWATYQPSQLPLGAWVMTPGCDWRIVLDSLLAALPGFAVSLAVTQQDPRLVPPPTPRADVEVLDYVQTGWIDVVGSFDKFWQARGKNLRQNLPKLRRRLEEQGSRLAFEFREQPDAVDAAFLEYATLESEGWKAEGGTSISVDNVQGSFYREMLRDYAGRGLGFAMRLALDGRAIAVDFGVRDSETLVILKTTYDEKFKAFSPAQLLHEQAFSYIFQQGSARRVEFYGKLMEWHSRWTEQSCTLYHVNLYRAPLLRFARDLAKWARRQARPANRAETGG